MQRSDRKANQIQQPLVSARRDDAQDTSIAQNVTDIATLQATAISQAATIAAQAALITTLQGQVPLAKGLATLVAGTKAVAVPAITAGSTVIICPKTLLGTLGSLSFTVSAGVGFTVNSLSALDLSVVSYVVFA